LKRMIGIAGVALWFWHCTAAANLVSMDFVFPGVVFDVPPGSTVTFNLSYDSNAVDTDPDPNVGAYAGKLIFISDGISAPQIDATVNVTNAAPGTGADVFGISEVNFPIPPPPFPIVDTHAVDSAAFSLLGDQGDMLSNDKLPTNPDFASQASSAFVVLHRVDVEGADSQPFLPGEFTVVSSPVPEPSTYVVMGVGLLAALLVARGKPYRLIAAVTRDRRRDS